MKPTYWRPTFWISAPLALALVGCGGDSPTGPSEMNHSVTLRGTVLGLASSSSLGVAALSAAEGVITVTVEEDPNITTIVGEDGTFTLRGLPEGSFTLVFTDEAGLEIGRFTFAEVLPNQEITITVELGDDGRVRLVEEERDGIGHGDIEIEGFIDAIATIQTNGATEDLIVVGGFRFLVRPGQTSIRQGDRRLTLEDLDPGDQVHVKGEWLPLDGGDPADQLALALEIVLQEDDPAPDDDPGGGGGAKITICHKKKNTLTISRNAWPAHQAHGDTMGACGS